MATGGFEVGGAMRLRPPFLRLIPFSTPTFVVIVALFLLAETLHWPEWQTALVAGVIAAVHIAIIVRRVRRPGRGATLLKPQHLAGLRRLHCDLGRPHRAQPQDAAGIMIISFVLYPMVREAPVHHEDPVAA